MAIKRLVKTVLFGSAVLFAGSVAAHATPRAHRGPTAPKPLNKRSPKAAPHLPAQHEIEPKRAAEIQAALVKSGYLTSSSGVWDSQTEAAMQKLQEDNGWQTKIVPDARAIIKLGLGPNNSAANSSPALPSSSDLSAASTAILP